MEQEIKVHPPWLVICPDNSITYRQITKKQLKKLCKAFSAEAIMQFILIQACLASNRHKADVTLRLLHAVDLNQVWQEVVRIVVRLLLKMDAPHTEYPPSQLRVIRPLTSDSSNVTELDLFFLFCHSFLMTMPRQISPVERIQFEAFYQLAPTPSNTWKLKSIIDYMEKGVKEHLKIAKQKLRIRRSNTQQQPNNHKTVIVKLHNGNRISRLSKVNIQPTLWNNPLGIPQLHLVPQKDWLFSDVAQRQPKLIVLNMLCPSLQQEEFITVEGDKWISVMVRQLREPSGYRSSRYASQKIELLQEALKCCKKYSSIVVELAGCHNQSFCLLLLWMACSSNSLTVNVRQNGEKLEQSTVEMIEVLSQRNCLEQIEPLLGAYDKFRQTNRMDISFADYLLDFSYV